MNSPNYKSEDLTYEKILLMFAETDRKFIETDRKFIETDRKFIETREQFAEMIKAIAQQDAQYKEQKKI